MHESPSDELIVGTARAGLSEARLTCKHYLSALEDAVGEEPLACGTLLYAELHRSASESGQWTVVSLLRCATQEAEEARRLWARATGCGDPDVQQQLKRAAVERSEQVVAYVRLIDVAFPGALTPQLREDLSALAPGYALVEALPDPDESSRPISPAEVVLLNLQGLRKTVLNDLQRAAIMEHCSVGDKQRAAAVLDVLRRDHLDQVAWTAGWLERAVDGGKLSDLEVLIARGLRDFNRATTEEAIDLTYHQRFGNHP
jgi:hypothetical protein